jgi:hypothetical protein
LDNFLYRRVARVSNSWASHVGLAFKDHHTGEWYVYESTVFKGKKTPLCQFLGRAAGDHYAIGRLKKPLSPAKLEALWAWTTDPANYGQNYDLGFDLDEAGTNFCSKFVYNAFRRIGVEIGRVQTFRELFDGFKGPEKERTELVNFFKTFMLRADLPWARRTVTPASQLEDPRLTIWEHR